MEKLPDNWNIMTHEEKETFFSKYYYHYMRPGEIDGIWNDLDESIQKAYKEFLIEEHD